MEKGVDVVFNALMLLNLVLGWSRARPRVVTGLV